MASLFSMTSPRPSRAIDNLLGIDEEIGMFDSENRALGRAPVDELWAGRYSAVIDDEDFAERERVAELARQVALNQKPTYLEGVPEFQKVKSEQEWLGDAREYIYDESGLDLYPGHLRADESNPIYMEEFSDKGAKFRDGAWDALVKAASNGGGVMLGDVFDHEELYKHYPEIQMLPVALNSNMGERHRGSYLMPREGLPLGAMHLNPLITDEVKNRETMLHEIQHFIQRAEGWEGGGSSSTQTGLDFAENLLNSSEAHVGKHDSPTAHILADQLVKKWDETEGLMDFMKRENFGEALAFDGYTALTGEQLARDVTARDNAGIQGENIYYGGTDRVEHENWNHTDATFKPMAIMPELRNYLMENGLLGPILDSDGNQVKPHGAVDPYVQRYIDMVGK